MSCNQIILVGKLAAGFLTNGHGTSLSVNKEKPAPMIYTLSLDLSIHMKYEILLILKLKKFYNLYLIFKYLYLNKNNNFFINFILMKCKDGRKNLFDLSFAILKSSSLVQTPVICQLYIY